VDGVPEESPYQRVDTAPLSLEQVNSTQPFVLAPICCVEKADGVPEPVVPLRRSLLTVRFVTLDGQLLR
jgi:hypothetical protein